MEYLKGMIDNNPKVQHDFYVHCKNYYKANYHGVFFTEDKMKDELFHNSFITMWENIERKKLYIKDDVIIGKDNKPLASNLTTYFMGIAKNKNLEQARSKSKKEVSCDNDEKHGNLLLDIDAVNEWLSPNEEDARYEIISDCIAEMPEQCRNILTLFYVHGKKLDDIMVELHTITTKDALKTRKNKCMNTLRKMALDMYKTRRNQNI